MKLFRWEKGRQGTGYEKFLIASSLFPLPFDCLLIKYPEGTYIGPHKDPVELGKHYRLNIVIKKSPSGGDFVCLNPILNWGRIKLFRPDQSEHSVTKVVGGSRYVLSIGWIWK